MTGTPEVLAEQAGNALRLTVDRPERLNALTLEVVDELISQVERGHHDPAVRAITITGAGRAFCAGADLDPANLGDLTLPDLSLVDAANRLVLTMRAAPKPVIALVNGPAVGVGSSLAMAADLVFASSAAYLKLGFEAIGLMPDGGGTALLPAAVGRSRALNLALLGDRISADQALEWGIFARVFTAEEFEAGTEALVARLADGPTRSYAATKLAINEATLPALTSALDLERAHQRALLASDDFAEGAAAFNDKRSPVFTGH